MVLQPSGLPYNLYVKAAFEVAKPSFGEPYSTKTPSGTIPSELSLSSRMSLHMKGFGNGY
jgi:hypothetical protein